MNNKHKFIWIGSMLVSIVGIISAFINMYSDNSNLISFAKSALGKIILPLLYFATLHLNFTDNFAHYEIWNLLFYILLFFGSLQFGKSKGRESRLLGFVVSVIFIHGIFTVFQSLLYKFFIMDWKSASSRAVFNSVYGFLVLLTMIGLSYYTLKLIKSQKQIDITVTETKTIITDTGKWQRFVHWMIDLLIIALIITPIIMNIGHWITNNDLLREGSSLEFFFRSRWALYAIILVSFFIYYPVTEILFGSTPGKFLTESRVVNSKAKNPDSSTIFLRTLCRNIPFNAVSFLWKRGWHDSISETYVIKEKRTGFKADKLLWILPLVIIYLFAMYCGKEYYQKYQSKIDYQNIMDEKVKYLESEIKNPNTNQIFVIEAKDYYGNIKNYGFKVETIEGNIITVKRLTAEFFSETSYDQARYYYNQQKDTAQIFTINKQEFVKNFPKNREELYESLKTMDFFNSGIQYQITDVYDLSRPNITVQISTSMSDLGSKNGLAYFKNSGASATVLSIKNIKNDIKWKTTFPFRINSGINAAVVFDVNNYDSQKENTAEIEVLDSLQKKHTYLLTASGSGSYIKKIR